MLDKQCQKRTAKNAMFFEWVLVNSLGLNSMQIIIENKAKNKYKKDPHVRAGLLSVFA